MSEVHEKVKQDRESELRDVMSQINGRVERDQGITVRCKDRPSPPGIWLLADEIGERLKTLELIHPHTITLLVDPDFERTLLKLKSRLGQLVQDIDFERPESPI